MEPCEQCGKINGVRTFCQGCWAQIMTAPTATQEETDALFDEWMEGGMVLVRMTPTGRS